MADAVSPLYRILQAQATLDHSRASTRHEDSLGALRFQNVLLNQQAMQREEAQREMMKGQFNNPASTPGGAGGPDIFSKYEYDSPLITSARQGQEGIAENRKLLAMYKQTGDVKEAARVARDMDNQFRESRIAMQEVAKDDERRNREAAQVFGQVRDAESAEAALQYVNDNLGQRQAKAIGQQLAQALPGGIDNATPQQIEAAMKPIVNRYNSRGNIMRSESALMSAANAAEANRIKELDSDRRAARAQAGGKSDGATAGDGFSSSAPGGPGSVTLVDPNTGQTYMRNRDGSAFMADENGKFKAISPNDVPKNAVKAGNIGTAGSREASFNQRIILAGNQAAKDLANVVELPTTVSTGIFGGRKQGPGLLSAGKEVLANTITGQEAQLYNSMATGFQRSLAAIESAGLMPSGQLTHQMDAVMLKEGDTNLTKLSKLAQVRQIVEAGMEVLVVNPRISDGEKDKARDIIDNVRKAVPYTQKDVIRLYQTDDDSVTLKDLIKPEKVEKAATPEKAAIRSQGKTEADPVLLGGGGGDIETQFNALPSGYYFRGPDGKTRRKP